MEAYIHPIRGSIFFLVRHKDQTLEILSRVGYFELMVSGHEFDFIRHGYKEDLAAEVFLLETAYFNDKSLLEILCQEETPAQVAA
ncbi:MAG: hypothetical protein WC045_01145 [Patescibacteria group bacterium]